METFREKLKEFTPYALHLAMVAAVVAYVIGGAITIRQIEASPVEVQNPVETSSVSSSSTPEPNEGWKDGYYEPLISVKRTKECVVKALKEMSKMGNCSQVPKNLNLLDACYADDLKKIALISEQRQFEATGSPANVTTKNEIIDGYEYWTIMDSVLFCFTVITTIGYGNVAPRTFQGRLFVIIYGLIGVPFTMMAIANIGKFLATLLKTWTRPFLICCRKMRKRMASKKTNEIKETQRLMENSKKKAKKIEEDVSSNGEEENAEEDLEESEGTETFVLFFAFVVYIVVGSIVIAAYEPEMEFFEAIYFNFVTLTTIGLGDLVPKSDTYLAITLIYCAIGLALTTIAIDIAADTLKKLHYFGRKIDNVANVQVWFGGQKISMKALVKNLGDQFNVPVEELENLNLCKFVDDAIKVEAGELSTLRNDRAWMNSEYWRAIESGSMHYMDDEDLVTIQSNLSGSHYQIPRPRKSRSYTVTVNPEPLIDTASENIDVDFVSEGSEEPQPLADIQEIENEEASDVQNTSTCVETQRLLQAFKDYQNEINAQDGRWSEEARRKYLEYQIVWRRFRESRNMH